MDSAISFITAKATETLNDIADSISDNLMPNAFTNFTTGESITLTSEDWGDIKTMITQEEW